MHRTSAAPRAELEARWPEFRSSLFRWFSRSLPDDAEDLIQDVFVAAAACLAHFTPDPNLKDPLRAWLSGIARHTLSRRIRELRSGREQLLSLDPERVAETDPDWAFLLGDARSSCTERAERIVEMRLRRRMAHLSPEQAFAWDCWAQGWKLKWIAREMAVSIETARRRKNEAVRIMRDVDLETCTYAGYERFAWRKWSDATLYHAPITVGAALAAEQLRQMEEIDRRIDAAAERHAARRARALGAASEPPPEVWRRPASRARVSRSVKSRGGE
jgi:RNA polymerase sigma factor (sigma-70 family)